jgi:hypothetical protein
MSHCPFCGDVTLSREEFSEIAGKLARGRRAIEALEEIAAIENKEFGPDWEEIDEARNIATGVLDAVGTGKEP